jgi:hypothetical protein
MKTFSIRIIEEKYNNAHTFKIKLDCRLNTGKYGMLGCRQKRQLPDMECSYKYIKYAVSDSQQGEILQFGG